MFALLLSTLVLAFSWMTAHLFAVPAVYFVQFSRLRERMPFRALHAMGGAEGVRYLRKLVFMTILIGLVLLLAVVVGVQPAYLVWVNTLQTFVDFELTHTLMTGLLNNLMLSLGIFVVYQVTSLLNEFFPRLYRTLHQWRQTRFQNIRIKGIELLTPDQITDGLVSLTRYLQIGLNLVLILTGLTFAMSFFPGTQALAFSLIDKFGGILAGMGQNVLDFLPNLFTLVVIAVITRYALKLLHFLYEGVRADRIKIAGLHPELAEPTYQLLRFLTLAIALVSAYPYLPGSESPVFRGITIFVGFLLSLGSTSLVTNIISGLVLTYTRGLRIGDRVQIGDTVGDVLERTLLVTRVRTNKNVVVTIPNGMVLNSQIINYSAPMLEEGLILHSTVTIGYDVPWRQVHELLIRAALATPQIEAEPVPFVLQTSLDDYYVSYQINAYTQTPEQMARIYSDLHQNIQDSFAQAGVEIMSPAYTAFRDGAPSTIPTISPAVQPAGFNLNAFLGVQTQPNHVSPRKG